LSLGPIGGRLVTAAVLAGALGVSALAPASAAPHEPAYAAPRGAQLGGGNTRLLPLPSPPRPPAGIPRPTARASSVTSSVAPADRTSTTSGAERATSTATAAAATPSTAKTFGPTGPAKTLVLYDTTSEYGWLGELYALGGGTLATHFGSVTAEPVSSYVAGQIADYTAVIYFGSTYNEALPAAFLSDVMSSSKPVLWSGFNVWQLSGTAGSTTAQSFQAKYGWDASTSYLDTSDTFPQVQYKGRTLTRSTLNTAGLLAPHITNSAVVTVLASARCYASDGTTPATACNGIAQTTGTSVPWAIRSANLTYIGEIPLSYMNEHDRYLAYADLLYPALAPTATASKRAAVRLEDVNPTSDPTTLRQFADYLSRQGVPFQVGVVPEYDDPNGVYNNGVPQRITLAQEPDLVSALKYMQSKGGVLVQHGWTHQYSNVANPYNGVTGDDFEFYRAECSRTQTAPYQFEVPCQITDWVIQEGPLPGDSQSWAANRVITGRNLFTQAGLAAPSIFETPHYSGSAADYRGMRQVYATRYEREQFFGGLLNPAGSPVHVFGQFFPYSVTDVYGSKVLPEDLGNYEPEFYNNNPPRSPQDIINNAAAEQVVTQSVASFFFHPDYPLSQLQTIVSGIKGLGYSFVPASQL
jgi:uncharacterized protein YdaL